MDRLRPVSDFPQSPLGDYLKLPKEVGSVPADELYNIGDQAVKFAQKSPSVIQQVRHLSVAGSAFCEAALVAEDDDELLNARLETIDYAGEAFDLAIERQNVHINNDTLSPDSVMQGIADLERLKLDVTFTRAYSDIVCGEVTPESTTEILEGIRERTEEAKKYLNGANRHYMTGLIGELIVLYDYWVKYSEWQRYDTDTRQRIDGVIALPATQRGDNGTHHRTTTHDIMLFSESYTDATTPSDFQYTGYHEVKTGRDHNGRKHIDTFARLSRNALHVRHFDGRNPLGAYAISEPGSLQ